MIEGEDAIVVEGAVVVMVVVAMVAVMPLMVMVVVVVIVVGPECHCMVASVLRALPPTV